ncbi:MAG: hypothetical protein K2X77_03500 [Candidatus Obscuribacterales bacterium]|jgi:hypothetical protein|nr:hypothetical protein [Candidatus Obscuribacterales bacterium]
MSETKKSGVKSGSASSAEQTEDAAVKQRKKPARQAKKKTTSSKRAVAPKVRAHTKKAIKKATSSRTRSSKRTPSVKVLAKAAIKEATIKKSTSGRERTSRKKSNTNGVTKVASEKKETTTTKPSNVRSLDSVRSLAQRTDGDDHRKILAVDIGGSSVKVLVNGEAMYRKVPSGLELTPSHLVEIIQELAKDWEYDYISIGYPGLTGPNGPLAEPYNLGPGWVAFDFAAAFGKPVKVLNDAAMQAIGSYEGGRMLFLGVGTGLGSALIADGVIISLELSNLRWNSRQSVGDLTSKSALKVNGKRRWRRVIIELTDFLARSFLVDYVVVGGGNAKYLKDLPTGVRVGHNQAAFRGGFRVWELDFIPTMADSVSNKELRVIY